MLSSCSTSSARRKKSRRGRSEPDPGRYARAFKEATARVTRDGWDADEEPEENSQESGVALNRSRPWQLIMGSDAEG
jgi:hypothetical protein